MREEFNNERINLVFWKQIHSLGHQHSRSCPDAESKSAQKQNAKSFQIQKTGSWKLRTNAQAKKYGDDIDEGILCGFGQPLDNAALPHQVAEHK